MSKLITRSVRCGLAAAAAMLSMPAAQAQQAAPVMAPAAGSLEEVLVTARLDNAADTRYRNQLNHLKDLVPEMGRQFRLVYAIKF